jgi:two-component system, cell cycle response regulator
MAMPDNIDTANYGQPQVFAVSLLGFTDLVEQNIIRRFFEMSRAGKRAHGYASAVASAHDAEAVLLDVDDPAAVQAWRNLGGARLKTLQVGARAVDESLPWVTRPFSLRTIKELDHLVDRQAEGAKGATTASNVVELPLGPRSRTAQVLVVDDSPIVRSLMEMKLSAYGVQVDFAQDAPEALEKARSSPYQVVFMDVVMPGMDGYEACKRIKQDPATRHIEVIMLTSRDGMFDKMRGSMAGCNAYLVKPVEETKLKDVLDRHFRPVR